MAPQMKLHSWEGYGVGSCFQHVIAESWKLFTSVFQQQDRHLSCLSVRFKIVVRRQA